MLLALCLRVDYPLDASPATIQRGAKLLDDLLTRMETGSVSQASMALSADGLAAFEREGYHQTLMRVRMLAEARRIELLATPAHGAILPLLPEAEIRRQLRLNDAANLAWFGDLYRPECLWPTELAISPKVTTAAAQLGYSCILVDEAAMRVWPATWPGDRVDAVAGHPGFFAIPSSRALSARMLEGPIEMRRELESFVPSVETALDERYVVPTLELAEMDRALGTPANPIGRIRTVRLQVLLQEVSLEKTASLMPSSRRSTAEEVGSGLPFASWFAPDNQEQALEWRLLLRSVDLIEQLQQHGLTAVPAVQRLRRVVDVAERESGSRHGPSAARELELAIDQLSGMGEPLASEVGHLCRHVQALRSETATLAAQPAL